MRALLLAAFIVLFSPVALSAGPAPYASAKIYILDPTSVPPLAVSADYIRKNAGIVISLDVYTVEFFNSLHWDKHKHDPAIKDRAKPLVMIIDLYNRVQPDPPAEPRYETLYCTSKYAYSDEGNYIDITSLTNKTLKLPVPR